MTRRILTTLALLALTAAVSAGLLSTEEERPPYRIDLHPGWNLISFPGDPVDPALESVRFPEWTSCWHTRDGSGLPPCERPRQLES